jgi:hypothetical protein
MFHKAFFPRGKMEGKERDFEWKHISVTALDANNRAHIEGFWRDVHNYIIRLIFVCFLFIFKVSYAFIYTPCGVIVALPAPCYSEKVRGRRNLIVE